MDRSGHDARLLEEVSTPESSDDEVDPYEDDGEFGSDEDYHPSGGSESSDEEIGFGIAASDDSSARVSPSLLQEVTVINPDHPSAAMEEPGFNSTYSRYSLLLKKPTTTTT